MTVRDFIQRYDESKPLYIRCNSDAEYHYFDNGIHGRNWYVNIMFLNSEIKSIYHNANNVIVLDIRK